MSGLDEKDVMEAAETTNKADGVIPRAAAYMFDHVKRHPDMQYKFRCSFCEVYNEQVYDLLNLSEDGLAVRWSARGKFFYVQDLLVVECTTLEDIVTVVTEGHRNRHIGSTALNKDSSRSHSLLTVSVESQRLDATDGHSTVRYGKVVFVDLAGSEREVRHRLL